MSTPPFNARRLETQVLSDPANLAGVRKEIEAFCAECGFDETSGNEMGLCVNEAMANVMRHAYRGAMDRPVQVVAEFEDPSMRITVRDWGERFDTTMLPKDAPRDLMKPGGVGMICLRQLMDDITFTPMDQGTQLTMTRNRMSRGRRRA